MGGISHEGARDDTLLDEALFHFGETSLLLLPSAILLETGAEEASSNLCGKLYYLSGIYSPLS